MKRKYDKIIKKIARKEGVHEEIIIQEIKKAFEAGFKHPDVNVQAYWREIAPDGKLPDWKEIIEILTKKI